LGYGRFFIKFFAIIFSSASGQKNGGRFGGRKFFAREPEAKPRRFARQGRAKQKNFPFSFLKEKIGTHKSKKVKKIFLRGNRRQAVTAG